MSAAAHNFEKCEMCDKTLCGFKCLIKSGTEEDKGCTDMIKLLRQVQSHCVGVRNLVRVIYKMRSVAGYLVRLNLAIEESNAVKLQELTNRDALGKMPKKLYDTVFLQRKEQLTGWMKEREEWFNEKTTLERCKEKLMKFRESMQPDQLDTHECDLCERMVGLGDIARAKTGFKGFEDYHKAFSKCSWSLARDAISILEMKKGIAIKNLQLCNDCWTSMRNGQIPKFSPMNGMGVDDVPPCLTALNEYEYMFIMKVRPLMRVVDLRTMAQKDNMSGASRTMPLAKGIQGTITYMPMPLEPNVENTLTMLPQAKCVQFLLRNIPNKTKKMVMQNLCSFEKICTALKWLKDNNILYKDTVIGDAASFYQQLEGMVIIVLCL